jgi:hypothetical protein
MARLIIFDEDDPIILNDPANCDTQPSKRTEYTNANSTQPTHLIEFHKTNYEDVITVIVGAEQKAYVVHEKNNVASSQFFAAACSKGWKENATKVVRLPEVENSDVFAMYVHYVYTGSKFCNLPIVKSTEAQGVPADVRCAEVYILADQLLDIKCSTRALDLLQHLWSRAKNWSGFSEVSQLIYKNTPENLSARKLLVDQMTERCVGT